MTLASWHRVINAGVFLPLVVLVITVCGSPPEPEPSTVVDPALVETILPEGPKEEVVRVDPESGGEPEPADAVSREAGAAGVDVYEEYLGAATPSIAERIYLADIVVRAVFVSEIGGLMTFRTVEFLKDSGPDTFTIRSGGVERDTRWDHREAVLFLSDTATVVSGDRQSVSDYDFVDTTVFDYTQSWVDEAVAYAGNLPAGYTIDSANPVWLPSEHDGGVSGQSGAAGDSAEFITESGQPRPTITLAELKAKIAWIGGGEGIEGYEECIRKSLGHIRYGRDWEEYHGEAPTIHEVPYEIDSGAAKGTEVTDWLGEETIGFAGYDRITTEGEHAEFFEGIVQDTDDIPINGFSSGVVTTRPLPAGTYPVLVRIHNHGYGACNFDVIYTGLNMNVTVTAPTGTVWEAPNAAGFDSGGGELEPAAFTANSPSTAITALRYESGQVLLETNPSSSLEDLYLYFIKEDGTFDTVLAVVDGTWDAESKLLFWDVPDAPWSDGDKLMLRLSSTAPPNGPPEDSSSR